MNSRDAEKLLNYSKKGSVEILISNSDDHLLPPPSRFLFSHGSQAGSYILEPPQNAFYVNGYYLNGSVSLGSPDITKDSALLELEFEVNDRLEEEYARPESLVVPTDVKYRRFGPKIMKRKENQVQIFHTYKFEIFRRSKKVLGTHVISQDMDVSFRLDSAKYLLHAIDG